MRTFLTLLATLPMIGAAPASGPTVVELFTSQGCSSCPPADLAVGAVADRPDVIALSFNVTYWNHLGWKDTFSRPEFTARQVAYVRALGHASPFTPQVVAGGRADAVGNTRARVEALIARARTKPLALIEVAGDHVSISSGVAPRGGADVWLVRYDPRWLQVPVRAGENGGKTLPQRNVVRELVRLGDWTGAPARCRNRHQGSGLASVIILQGRNGGAILAAARAG
jgi:hypothetical protein